MRRPFPKVMGGGEPVCWLGANFWSRSGGPLMWRDYRGDVVAAELGVLAGHGLTLTRSFFYWPDFMPEPDTVDEKLVTNFADFLDRHIEAGMRTIPTFIVGHMSGENWDPAWRGGRDLYGDVWLVARQAWFVREMTARFARHPAVAGWLISNEMPIYAGTAAADRVTSWAELMVQAVRAGGGTQPVSIGDGAWGMEVTGVDNGYSVRALAERTDFVGPHVYQMADDPVRQHLAAAFACELAAVGRRPVVLEEFGCTTDFAAPDQAGHYYRQVLNNALLAGASGWLAWNNTDYDHLYGQDPYRHHPFEMHFGITDCAGAPKPPLREMAAFAQTLRLVDVARCERLPSQAALIVSAYLEGGYPFTVPDDRTQIHDSLRQSYAAARAADLPPVFLREVDGIAGGCRLYLLPSTKQLTAPGWHRLRELAEGGAWVYVSYCAGEHPAQRGPWYADLNGLFGVEHRLRYGLADPIEGAAVTFTMCTSFGSLPAGDTLTFVVAGNEHGRAFLPVRPRQAEVLATDDRGEPALLLRRIGDGGVVLCTYPIEYMAARMPRVNPEDTWRLYAALAEAAGVERPVTVADPRVFVDGLERADGTRFVWLVSQAETAITVTPRVGGGAYLMDPEDGAVATAVRLPPLGVRVLRLTTTETEGAR